LTKIQLRNLNRRQQQNTDQTSASKSRLNFNFKILTKVLKVFMDKPQLPNLQQTVLNTILITNSSNSNNPNKF